MKIRFLCIYFLLLFAFAANAQPHARIELKKPEKYQNKILASEKTQDTKFGLFRRFTQNGITKFNWHFNAKTRLDQLLGIMKRNHQDDYTQLLPFYNYNPHVIAQSSELDTVLTKTNAGILVHDLRNAWIDNLYLLMGQAYFYKQNYDTAFVTFQHLNYAFAPKEDDGYDIPIGSNATEEGSPFKVSTVEKTDLAHKAWARSPSRNESLVWQIKTLIAAEKYSEAASLIQVLRLDPYFPERLAPMLAEAQSWYFYELKQYDSSAHYLIQALEVAENREEKARWEYLIGQMYVLAKDNANAEQWFKASVKHTLNPVLEVYGRLNQLRLNKNDQAAFQENINTLLKMGRREQYMFYRDVIFYTAAQMELERDSVQRAKALLAKAATYVSAKSSAEQRSRAFLLLGTLHYQDAEYADAGRNYDSVTIVPANAIITPKEFETRKAALTAFNNNTAIIQRQDSLQQVALLSEEERYDLVRKIIKAYRKQQGLKDDEMSTGFNGRNESADLFGGNTKGEWYFNNPGLKSQGITAFQTKWGRRPNVDNWRRSASINTMASGRRNTTDNTPGAAKSNTLTYDDLLAQIPLTETQLKASNDSIEAARFITGKILVEEVENYRRAVDTLELYVENYPGNNKVPEALFLLYYCYFKLGMEDKAQLQAGRLQKEFPGSIYNRQISSRGEAPTSERAFNLLSGEYEELYNAYIEGNFAQALDLKKGLDTIHGSNYYTPQLLYIEAIYHLKTRQIDYAKSNLQQIISKNSHAGMTAKAKTLLDVINRKSEIEAYLNALEIEIPEEEILTLTQRSVPPTIPAAPKEDTLAPVVVQQPVTAPAPVKADSVQTLPPTVPKDTLAATPKADSAVIAQKPAADTTIIARQEPPVVKDIVAKDTIAAVQLPIMDTAQKAGADSIIARQEPPVVKDTVAKVAKDTIAAVQPTLADTAQKVAVDTAIARQEPPAKDTIAAQIPAAKDTLAAAPAVKDSTALTGDPRLNIPVMHESPFTINVNDRQLVLIVLNKVDQVYVNETKNAFDAYHRSVYSQHQLTTHHQSLDSDNKFVVINSFDDAAKALDYIEETRAIANNSIVPWLPVGKYYFIMVSGENLSLIKESTDLNNYMKFLAKVFPTDFEDIKIPENEN